jgi:hypothetical protein
MEDKKVTNSERSELNTTGFFPFHKGVSALEVRFSEPFRGCEVTNTGHRND